MRRQVLVVEDNFLNRTFLADTLSTEYEVMEAANGHDYTKSGGSENWNRTYR